MRRIVKIVLLVLLVFGYGVSAFSQERGGKSREEMRKEIEEFKIKFLAQEIELKDDQKAEFVDLYSKMSAERMKAFSKAMQLERKLRKSKDATEEEYAAASKAMNEARDKEAEITKKYSEKFSTFLTNKQLYKLKTAEEKFRRKMEEMRANGKAKRPHGTSDGGKYSKRK